MNDPQDLSLTRVGCEELCGSKRSWYEDIGPRLSVWLIPILLLLSNIELSPLDKRRFLAIIHVMGDPIDSFWSLVHKLDAWDRCATLASRYGCRCGHCRLIIATVFAGVEELDGPRIRLDADINRFVNDHYIETRFQEWRRAAVKLADHRTNEFARACLAIALYVYQLIAGFVKEVGGDNSSPPGGRIATGVFLSWLIPTVLLSNALGNFPSRRTCYDILHDFRRLTERSTDVVGDYSVFLPGLPPFVQTCSSDFFQSLSWSGGIYTFRPWKARNASLHTHQSKALLLLLLSISPVCIGLTGAFLILWFLIPTGFNCRHTWIIGIFLAWVASTVITSLSHSPRVATGKYHLRFVLLKDVLVAVPSITIIFLSACGLFNDCKCWSGYLQYRSNARVALNTHPFFEHNDRTVYPLIVGVSLVLQLLVFGSIAFFWRRGLRVFRWSESIRSEQWHLVKDNRACPCMNDK